MSRPSRLVLRVDADRSEGQTAVRNRAEGPIHVRVRGAVESWKDKATGERLYTYAIVTTDPNEVAATLHNRMPAILLPKDYDRWLAPVDLAHLPIDLLRPFPADMMTAWKVNKAVGNVKNDDSSLIAPI